MTAPARSLALPAAGTDPLQPGIRCGRHPAPGDAENGEAATEGRENVRDQRQAAEDALRRSLRGFIRSRLCGGCPGRGQGLDEDLAQEVLLALHRRGVAFCVDNWAYIKKVAVSRIEDCRRRNRHACIGRSEGEPSGTPPALPDPWECERLWHLLARCGGPAAEVVCFIWVKLLEYGPAEVTAELGPRPVRDLLEEGIREYARIGGFREAWLRGPFGARLADAPQESLRDFLSHRDGPARAVTYAVDNVRRRLLRCLRETRR